MPFSPPTYTALLDRLKQRGIFHIHPGLERTQTVLRMMGNPQDRIPSVHIAGTNGKGSVAAALDSVLRAAGYRIGLYISPSLLDDRERFQINGHYISQTDFVRVSEKIFAAEQRTGITLTYFEFFTVIAFQYFYESKVDMMVIETGLGGAWDSTNVLSRPEVAIITSIGLDHTQWLGKTVSAIAQQKAGIIKANCTVVTSASGKALQVIARTARRLKSPLLSLGKDFKAKPASVDWQACRQTLLYSSRSGTSGAFPFGLLGLHQIDNAATALTAAFVLRRRGWAISSAALAKGLAHVQWPGRFQIFRTPGSADVILDGAHNPPAIERLLQTLQSSPYRKAKNFLVFSAYSDKDFQKMATQLGPKATKIYLAALPGSRSLPIPDLQNAFQAQSSNVVRCSSIAAAFKQARKEAGPKDVVIATGSLAVVGQTLSLLKTQNALQPSSSRN